MLNPSLRSQVEPFRVMQMLDIIHQRRREGKDTIMLCAGQPSTGAPRPALEAVSEALFDESLGYTEVVGDVRLRETVAAWHSRTYGLDTSPGQVIITTGSSGAFSNAFLALLDHGDRVAITAPGYPAYRNILASLGAEITYLKVGAETRFQATATMLEELAEKGEKPKMVIVTSPGNPTGTIIDPAELERIARWCEDNGCALISDEDYHGISFGRPTATARKFSDDAIVVGTLSKYFSMTGWRVGWMIVPDNLVEPLTNLQASLSLCAPAVSQVAGVAAFGEASISELNDHVERYREARAVLLEELPRLGLDTYADPDGGLYLWLNVEKLTDDSEELAHRWVEEIGVAVAPGIDFDPFEGHKWVRLSLCTPADETREACRRIASWISR